MAKMGRLALIAAAAIAVPGLYVLGSPALLAQLGRSASATGADATLAFSLAQEINGEAGRLPAATASIEDYEASILFVINQRDYSLETILAALDIVEGQVDIPNAERIAIGNVRRSLATRRKGTGALGDGVGDAFSTPLVGSGGGGSTDYTSAQ